MFFILSKILLFTLSPYTWLLIAIYFALFSKKTVRAKRAKYAAIFIALFFSNTFIYKEFCRQWEIFGTPISQVKHYDVAIVLTGMAEYNNDLQVLSARRGIDRIWQTISLYKAGKIDRILISGDHGYLIDKGLHEATQLKEILVKWGIPEHVIITETKSKNTYENAVESQKIVNRLFPNSNAILLVTSGRHMRRARACFNKLGLKCDTYSTDLFTGPNRSFTFDELIIPDVSTMSDWHSLLKEMIGYIAYDMTGKI
ncbi:YdcF family protein [Fluviicola taffensis]|uniref:DUF218 domain-containing protein n=1 Tax=Fluviicola taffensis (strain DSM 16823 / NCIMB 13979 / RW262) TaxID=755732 RepID=F2IA99_FLUTR|nr:YdcF family protein [Fluviicola taffensis]AEA42034.1 protein of unknown function DUF218 [Fluviicola taffensis DSM 16823]